MNLWQHFPKFLKSQRSNRPKGSIPQGERVYAIGDVHGRLDLLDALLDQIHDDAATHSGITPQIILLGDLIDRGPDSAGVVERLCCLVEEGAPIRLLKGNHEEVFLRALHGDAKALKFLCRIGGRETLLSYGISERDYNELSYEDLLPLAAERVGPRHLAFLDSFEDMIIIGDYAFVHAGVRPGVALAEQVPADLRWIRGEFLDHSGALEKVVVHGHTVCVDPEFRGHRIGIDTGAYASGRLTALVLEGETMRRLEASEEKVMAH